MDKKSSLLKIHFLNIYWMHKNKRKNISVILAQLYIQLFDVDYRFKFLFLSQNNQGTMRNNTVAGAMTAKSLAVGSGGGVFALRISRLVRRCHIRN